LQPFVAGAVTRRLDYDDLRLSDHSRYYWLGPFVQVMVKNVKNLIVSCSQRPPRRALIEQLAVELANRQSPRLLLGKQREDLEKV
jgi:hypothetical protein